MYLGFRVDYTLHVLDSMFIVTLCSSSIIIYVLIIIRNTSFARTFSPSNTNQSTLRFTFDLANPWEGLHVTPKMCHFTTRSVAFSRSTTPIHRKNERARKSCNFTSRSVTRPGQSIVKIERHASRHASRFENVSFYLAFLTLTYRIPGKGCAFPLKCVILRRVQSRSVARPGQSIVKIEAPSGSTKCATLPRVQSLDHANPS